MLFLITSLQIPAKEGFYMLSLVDVGLTFIMLSFSHDTNLAA